MVEKLFCYIFAILIVSTLVYAEIGDKCEIKYSGRIGRCQISCPTVEEEAKLGIDPTLCGFHQIVIPIVCCPIEQSSEAEVHFPESNQYKPPENDRNRPDADPLTFPDDPELSGNRLRVSQQKCEEYSKPFSEVVQALPLVPDTEPISLSIEKCDYNSVPLIVGGEPALAGEFPFMAAVGFQTDDQKWRCGGTLISDRFILTAAHCTSTRDAGSPSVIRLGELDFSTIRDGSEYQDYDVEEIIVHPEYTYPLKYHDIALIKTTRPVQFTKYIRPACLYIKKDTEQPSAVATGWGKTDYAAESSSRLMKVALNIYDNNRCSKAYQTFKDLPRGIDSRMLCAGELKGGKDTCQGDSGGPLLLTKPGNQCKFYVIGVTSFGKSCGQYNTPAVYTKVSSYIDWIERNVW